MKQAVVYDKWLSSLGGGEVVACNMVKILKELGYDVTLISGKKVSIKSIEDKLSIDLNGVDIKEVWNDEVKLKELVSKKDLFINTSFMDYSLGFAKKNIYYTHFPTKSYESFSGMVFNNFVLPFLSNKFKSVEFMTDIEAPVVKNKRPAYLLKNKNQIAISYLEPGKVSTLDFHLFFESFYKSLLEDFGWDILNAKIISREIEVSQYLNEIYFKISFIPYNSTIYLNLDYSSPGTNSEKDNIYLLYPKIQIQNKLSPLKQITGRIKDRLRAGVFINTLARLKSYNIILANSYFTKFWIGKYWGRKAIVLFPPVEMLFKKYKIKQARKRKMICSVGRFFTLGHGKKQEVLIEAFKKFYEKGYKDWELHLAGGLGNEPTSIKFSQALKEMINGYPIYLHFNASRKTIEDLYINSKVYWHAAGINEDESSQPVKFEHFGIAPVEAIGAGCIPILYDGGGLKEIINILQIDDKKNMFKNIDQLVNNTIYQINSTKKYNWEKIFAKINSNFSVEAFKKRFIKIID